MVAIPPKGELSELPLPRLLLDLHRARFDGRLHMRRDSLEKTFLFQRGCPVFAESNRPSETLGVQLMDSGRISREDYHRVSAYVTERKVKEGTALLELNLLDPKALFVALKHQVRVRILECFGWPRGDFEVEPEESPPEGAQPFRSDPYVLVQEGLAQHWTAEQVLTDLTPRMEALVARNRRLSRIQERLLWDDDVQTFVDALDGTRTLWQALQQAKTPRVLATAWLLDAIQAVDYRDPAAATAEPEPDVEIVLRDATARSESARPRAAAGAEPRAGAEVDEVLMLEISQKYVALGELDHYALLGVAQDAAPALIKRAYLDAAKRYHPDALARAGLDAETRDKAGKVFAAIGKAHAVLSNPKRRHSYDASLASDESDLDAERLAAAEMNFRKGEILMRQGNFRGALDYLKPAVDLWPEDGTYQAALGWALYKATPSKPVEARQHLERAYELEPRNAETAYRLSLVLKTLGETAPAANLLAKARELDPSIGG